MTQEQTKAFISKIEAESIKEINSSPRQNARVFVKRLLGDPAHLIAEMLQNAEDAGQRIKGTDAFLLDVLWSMIYNCIYKSKTE